MKIFELVMPQMGESIMECTVLSWLKQPGEKIDADDSILEVATDKVDTEVPSPVGGRLLEWLVQVGDIVPIGSPVARLEVADTESLPLQVDPAEPDVEEVAKGLEEEINVVEATMSTLPDTDGNSGFYSPLVQRIAKEEGVSHEELTTISGTGSAGRVTKDDIKHYISSRKVKVSDKIENALEKKSMPVIRSGKEEIIEMDRMRKMIAQRMLDSKKTSPHVTSFIETDMTRIVKWREQVKETYRKQTGNSITFTPILIEAVIKAIRDFPMINISVDGDKIIVKKNINVGVAVALPDGNLIVPVLHQADQYSLGGLARKVNELSKRARENKLTAEDVSGGTYTVSNIGTFGNIMGTPIIVQPQVAIMAFGAIQKKPAVIETPDGDLIGVRHLMYISHSYDHRVVDGSLGGMFLKRVSDYLEKFDTNRPVI